MNSTNPTRRTLLGGLLTLLFGWLWLGKPPKGQAQTNPEAEQSAETEQVMSYSYDVADDLGSTEQESLVSETVYTYDAENRLIRMTDRS